MTGLRVLFAVGSPHAAIPWLPEGDLMPFAAPETNHLVVSGELSTGSVAAMTKTKSPLVSFPVPACRLESGAAGELFGDPELLAFLWGASGSRWRHET